MSQITSPTTPQATLNMAAPRTSLRAAYAKNILHKHLLAKLNDVSPDHHDVLPAAPGVPDKVKDESPYQGRVCIIGAGAAGLYTAMMLEIPRSYQRRHSGSY